MVQKKSNVVSINFNDTAILCLQRLQYLDGMKKSKKEKNLSEFISRLVLEYVDLKYPQDMRMVQERLLKLEIIELQKKRDEIEDVIKLNADKITDLRNMDKDYKK